MKKTVGEDPKDAPKTPEATSPIPQAASASASHEARLPQTDDGNPAAGAHAG